ERNIWKMRAHGSERIGIVQSPPRADWRAPRHQNFAARFEQFFRHDQIVVHIGKHFEAFVAKDARSFHETEWVGLQCVVIANDLKLYPIGAKHFTRHFGRGHRFAHSVATGSIWQNLHAELFDQGPEILSSALFAAFTSQ